MIKLKFIVLYLFIVSYCSGQNSDKRIQGLETEIENLMLAYKAVGVSIAIVENNKVIYTNGFGYRDLERKLPVTTNTQFEIGSMTKQFTAALIGIYQEQGKLSVSDKPSKHLKNLKFYNVEMNSLITIEDLLAHRSGIGNLDGAHVFFPINDINKHIERLKYLKPNSTFRERFDYSNMGFALLGAIGESITKKTWSENVREDILEPMKMYNTNTSLNELIKASDFSYGYSIRNEKPTRVLYENQNESAASGAMNSSANDMSKWALMLLNKGIFNGKQIIPKAYLENSFSQHQIISPSFNFEKPQEITFDNYGYGWFVHHYKGVYRVNHGGSVSGFTSRIDLFPHKNLGIVVLTNQDVSSLSSTIVDIISKRMLKFERKNWDDYEVDTGNADEFENKILVLNKDMMPSKTLQEYCGEYYCKGYGNIKIGLENNHLTITFPGFKMALQHHENDTFYTVKMKELHQNVPDFYYNFILNDEGEIVKLTAALQAEPLEFIKL